MPSYVNRKVKATHDPKVLNKLKEMKNGTDNKEVVLDDKEDKLTLTTSNVDENKMHRFWNNKPVMDYKENSTNSNQIEDISTRQVYNPDSRLSLPSGFKWDDLDLSDSTVLNEFTNFIRENYLEDKSGKFITNYTSEFLKWSLGTNYYVIGVRTSNGSLCATVAVSLKNVTVFDKTQLMGECTYLCVHQKLRGKNMSSVLIDEAVRVLCTKGTQVGVFTTERVVPSPLCKLTYFHRPLNYKKLNRLGFLDIKDVSSDTCHTHFAIEKDVPENCRLASVSDYEKIYELHKLMLTTFNISVDQSLKEFIHYYFENDFMKTYVFTNDKDEVVDYFSFYNLNTYSKEHNEDVKTAVLHTYTTNTHDVDELFDYVLRVAYANKYDQLNVTDNMLNRKALLISDKEDTDSDENNKKERTYGHKFLRGSGRVNFYFFNWKCPRVLQCQLCWTTF